MISGRVRDDPSPSIGLTQLTDRIPGAAKFESVDALQVFAFENDRGAHLVVDRRLAERRRLVGYSF